MSDTVNWKQIWSLLSLNAALIISWIAYHNYQPQILDQFGFEHYEGFLKKTKLLVLLIVPPLAGFIADKLFKANDKRVPLITVGVSLTALIFMLVASTIGSNPIVNLSAYLPYMIVFWLISMNIFYAPALAMLEKFVPASQFTIVMGIYVLTSDLIYALEPAIVGLINFFGAPFTFLFGGSIVLASGIWFSSTYKSWSNAQRNEQQEKTHSESTQPIKIWFYAFLFGVAFAYLMNVLPNQLEQKLIRADIGDYTGDVIVSGLLLFTALAAWGLSKRVTPANLKASYIFSFIGVMLLFVVSMYLKEVAALFPLILVVPTLAILSVSTFPLVMSYSSAKNKMLAAGLFISGVEFPDSVLELLL